MLYFFSGCWSLISLKTLFWNFSTHHKETAWSKNVICFKDRCLNVVSSLSGRKKPFSQNYENLQNQNTAEKRNSGSCGWHSWLKRCMKVICHNKSSASNLVQTKLWSQTILRRFWIRFRKADLTRFFTRLQSWLKHSHNGKIDCPLARRGLDI